MNWMNTCLFSICRHFRPCIIHNKCSIIAIKRHTSIPIFVTDRCAPRVTNVGMCHIDPLQESWVATSFPVVNPHGPASVFEAGYTIARRGSQWLSKTGEQGPKCDSLHVWRLLLRSPLGEQRLWPHCWLMILPVPCQLLLFLFWTLLPNKTFCTPNCLCVCFLKSEPKCEVHFKLLFFILFSNFSLDI